MKNQALKICLGIVITAFLLQSCGPDYKMEVERMMRERDSLMSQYNAKDSVINGYMADISSIQASIDSLASQEEILQRNTTNDPETTKDAKVKAREQLEAIRQVIENNKKKLGELQSRLKKNNVKMVQLEKMIESLNQQLAMKDSSISNLNTQIASLNGNITTMQTQMDTMRQESERKSAVITDKVTKLNTAYYTVGTYKQLRDKKVITKQGGFLGLGKQKQMIPDFSQDAFTQIDVTSTKSIALAGKDAKLLSTHPNGTYQIKKENNVVKSIEITDPDKFWKASKYLVVVTD